jgi:hypothetical protein
MVQCGELKGQIPLKEVGAIKPIVLKKKIAFCFEVQTPHRNYHLAADSKEQVCIAIFIPHKPWAACVDHINLTSQMDDWLSVLAKATQRGGEAPAPAAEVAQVRGLSIPLQLSHVTKPLSSTSTQTAAPEAEGHKVKVNDFDLIKVIGRGSYGKVLKVKHKGTGQVYAMKVLNKKVILDKNELEHTKNERSILVKLRSPFLVTLHYAFQTADRYTAPSSSPLSRLIVVPASPRHHVVVCVQGCTL